jgi:branched-chain amino acid transport system permease protein
VTVASPALPRRAVADKWAPHLVVPAVALAAAFLMDGDTWLTLTVAGVAMGMMLFLMSAGLTLIFGLMDVLNFAQGAFVTLGAYVAVSALGMLAGWSEAPSWALNLAALGVALVLAALLSGLVGWFFEAVIVRRVYGSHLRQILITMGGLIIAEQLVIVLWGPQPLALAKPASFRGSFVFGAVAIEKYRVIAVALGLAVFVALHLVLNRTRIGLLVRAGVENREMVEALGYRIRRLFVGVFVAGTALAGVGGVMWGLYQELVTAHIGSEMMILVFIVLIIGGLGSVGGCFVGAVLVGLAANYIGFLAPKLALGSNILLMAAVLMWRPRGLFPVAKP